MKKSLFLFTLLIFTASFGFSAWDGQTDSKTQTGYNAYMVDTGLRTEYITKPSSPNYLALIATAHVVGDAVAQAYMKVTDLSSHEVTILDVGDATIPGTSGGDYKSQFWYGTKRVEYRLWVHSRQIGQHAFAEIYCDW